MDLGKSFTYMFDDDRWGIKLIILALIILVGLLGAVIIIGPLIMAAFVLGYMVEIIRRVRVGDPTPLPDWDDIGKKFMDGLVLMIAVFIWALPLIVLSIPTGIASSAGDGEGASVVLALCFGCLTLIYSAFLTVATPAIYVSYAEEGTFSSALNFSRVSKITRDHLAEIIVMLIVLIIASFIASLVGVLLCGVGLALTLAYMYMVEGHMFGQLAAAASPTPLAGGLEPVAPVGWGEGPGSGGPEEEVDPEQIVDEVRRRSQEALDDLDDLS
jgi:ABC-type multidrug transport system fused ATPase/permease subunit